MAAPLAPREQALCAFAERLTLHVAHGAAGLDSLRAAGLDDEALLHVVEVVVFGGTGRLPVVAVAEAAKPERGSGIAG